MVGVVLFVAISVGLASFLSAEGVERDDLTALLNAQAKGDVAGMLHQLSGCRRRPACVATVRENASRLRAAGAPKILSVKSSTAYSLTSADGRTRLAWTVIGRRPVVQCVDVRRSGTALTGIGVALVSIGTPISSEGDC